MPETAKVMEASTGTTTGAPQIWIREKSKREKKIDFLIIGAQKAGTTSLHNYLSPHPALYLLPEKEVPYFTNEEYYAKGWDWYADEFFSQAPATKLWGKSTPNYMQPKAMMRIRAEIPHVKLIALLRNPIDRAYSHYKMMVKREKENRSFLQAVEEGLEPTFLKQQRHSAANLDERRYFFGGEYGRMLEAYYHSFPKEQLLILFTEDLKKEPEAVYKQVLGFLGVDDTFSPGNLGKQYHVGGTKRKISLSEQDLRHHPLFRKFLMILPRTSRHYFERRFLFWYMIWNTKPDPKEPPIPAEARRRLAEFYRDDVIKLNRLLGGKVAWPDFADL